MGKIFHEYGGTIITVIAVVLLISFVTTSMNTGGVLYNAFGSMINSFSEKANGMVDGAAGGSGEGEEAGCPISWNTMDVMDNPKVDMGDGTYLVKVSDYTPTAAELADTKGTLCMDGETMSSACLSIEDLDGIVIAAYDDNGEIAVISVTTTEVVDALGIAFPETGLWTIDYGSLGMDADVVIETIVFTKMDDGMALYDYDSATWYANDEATLTAYGLDTTSITYSTKGLPSDYAVGDGDIVMYGDYEYRYNWTWLGEWMDNGTFAEENGINLSDGWSVRVLDISKTTYCAFAAELYNEPVINIVGTFMGCANMTAAPTIHEGVSDILASFINCTNLSDVTIPASVTNIGNYAFRNCSKLTTITIPDSVTVIGNYAFANCTNLTSATIGDGTTSIGHRAFQDCTSLTSIVFEGSVEQWDAIIKHSDTFVDGVAQVTWNLNVPATEVVCSDGVVSLVD